MIKEIRNFFKSVFGSNAKTQLNGATSFQLLNRSLGIFSAFNGDIYDESTVRSCIHSIATHCAKLKPQHRLNKKFANTALNRMLSLRPNKYMSAYDFIYKTVTQLLCANNAFVYVHCDAFGHVTGLYPVNYSDLKLLEYQGELFVEFSFLCGKKVCLPYSELIHLRRHFNEDDIFGSTQREVLRVPLDVLQTINQGIINTIKLSTGLRGLLQFKSVTPNDKQKKIKDEFVEAYLNINNADGFATLDPSCEFKELKVEPQSADDKQTSIARENVYRFFNISEDIVRSKYNEEQYNAFYSSVIEPIAIQLSLEFTYKIFTDKEIGHGNEVIFSAERMTFASNATKADVISKLMPLGIYSINQACEIMEMPKINEDWADKRIISLNYVHADKADKYQNVEDKGGNDDNGKSNNDDSESESENDANS